MFEIRPAKPDDQESIQQIYTSFVGVQANQNRVGWEQLIRAERLLVARTEGVIIGFGGIDLQAAEQLKWLYILPRYQGGGLGSRLLQKLENIGWEAGLDVLRLHAAPTAVEFYRKRGYRAVDEDELIGHDHEGVELWKQHEADNSFATDIQHLKLK
jgi:N-acetylglutamate synthase-like GNAT family acetyltransferase